MNTLQEPTPAHKPALSERFTALLRPMIAACEHECRHLAKPGTHPAGSPRQNLLRVAHYALAALAALEDVA